MVSISVDVVVGARPEVVWSRLADVGSHVEWMADAESITFLGDQRQGVGVRFDCVTRIGPLRTVDRMSVTRWDPPRTMGVHHQGAVTGSGSFTLVPLPDGRTRLTWSEELAFPWWLGWKVGERVGAVVLRWVWSRNLARLRLLVGRDRGTGPRALGG